GLRLAVEPFQLEGIESWSILNTLGDAAEFLEEVGSDAVGIQFDVWHLWNTPGLLEEIPRHAQLIAGVHLNDWREPTRGWADRVLPGDGAADLSAILGVLEDVGWDGFYDLEIFSDNGAFGSAYPDSLWDLDAAELKKVNRKDVLGRKIVLKTCDTQKDDPTASKACADQLISEGAMIIFTTCDVDLAAPVVHDSINHGLLTVAPCIGTDQMGPKRFGAQGKLAFSFGNVAQDEGSAMAQLAWNKGWKTADLAKDTAIVYFKAVVSAF